jgi:putative transposase
VEVIRKDFGLSERRACRIMGFNRSTHQYRLRLPGKDEPLRQRLKALASEHPRWGCLMLHDLLRHEGWKVNHKRLERIYREEQLSLRRRRRKKLPATLRVPLPAADRPNQRWSMDFIHDSLGMGRRFRVLTIVDDYTRQSPALKVDTSLGGADVVRTLQELSASHGTPQVITVDNGPEFTSKALHDWARRSGVRLNHITPGKPMQNAYIESFNGRFREECLNEHWFLNIHEARLLIEDWRNRYNQIRPHSSIGRIPPDLFAFNFNSNHNNQTLNSAVA